MVMLTDEVVELTLTDTDIVTMKTIAGIRETSTINHVYRGFEGIYLVVDKKYFSWVCSKEGLLAAKGLGYVLPKRNSRDRIQVSDILRVNGKEPEYQRYH